MVSETGWSLHPDRALPSDPVVRPIAREILAATATLPIVSMHGHVDAGLLARDEPFADPASLLVTPDHYLVRMLVSQGVPHDALGVPRRDRPGVVADPREVWRTFATHWPLFRGTPTRYWLEHVFVEVFGLDERPSADSADRLFDLLSERLEKPAFRPLALFDEFGIEILATTDAATATLADHADLADSRLGRADRADVPARRAAARRPPRLAGGRRAAGGALGRSRSAGTATWCTRSRSGVARSSRPVRAPRTTGTSPRTRPR